MTTALAPAASVADLRVRHLTDDDQDFLTTAARTHRRQSTRGPIGFLWRHHHRMASRGRLVVLALALVACVAAIAATNGGGSVAFAATPNPTNNYCERGPLTVERADAGLSFLVPSGNPNTPGLQQYYSKPTALTVNQPNNELPNTLYEQYKGAGTFWSTYWLNCLAPEVFLNTAANQVFQASKIISLASIFLFKITFSGDAVNFFVESSDGKKSAFDTFMGDIYQNVWANLFGLVVVLAGVFMLWRFITGKLAASDFWGKFISMVLIAGFAIYIGSGTNGSALLVRINDWTVSLTNTVLTAFTPTNCTADGKTTALDCAVDSMFDVMIFTPWQIGELGSAPPENANAKPGSPPQVRGDGYWILSQQAFSAEDIKQNIGADQKAQEAAKNNKDSFSSLFVPTEKGEQKEWVGSFDHKYDQRSRMLASWGIKTSGASSPFAPIPVANTQTSKPNEILQDKPYDSIQPLSGENVQANYAYWKNYSGGNPGNRFAMAVLAMVAALALGTILVLVSVSYLLLEVSTVIFAIFALPAMLLGLIPGFGMRVFLRWLELFLGTFAKRIVLGLFVGLLIGFCQIIFNLDTQLWLVKMLFVVLVALFGIVYRKRFTEAFTFSFSGTEGKLQSDLFGMMANRIRGGIQQTRDKVEQDTVDVGMGVATGGASVPGTVARRQAEKREKQGMTQSRGSEKSDKPKPEDAPVFTAGEGGGESPAAAGQVAGRPVGSAGGGKDGKLEGAVTHLANVASSQSSSASRIESAMAKGGRSQAVIYVPPPEGYRQSRQPEHTRPLGRS